MAGKDCNLKDLAKGLIVKNKVEGGAVATLIKNLHVGPDDHTKNLAKAFMTYDTSNDVRVVETGAAAQPQPSASRGVSFVDKHIFISYCHREQETVSKIYRSLQAKGYKLWIDEYHMGGNLLSEIAKAVTDSWIVLLCISSSYQASHNCRHEAELTFTLKKEYMIIKLQEKFQPSDWLATIVGAKIYYDFSKDKPYEKTLQKLTKELENVKEKVCKIKNIPKTVKKK